MINRRTVSIVIDPEELDITKNKANIEAAIGYLASWSLGSDRHVNVTIYSQRDRELSEVYSNTEGKTTYAIDAVEREDGTYSYHS